VKLLWGEEFFYAAAKG